MQKGKTKGIHLAEHKVYIQIQQTSYHQPPINLDITNLYMLRMTFSKTPLAAAYFHIHFLGIAYSSLIIRHIHLHLVWTAKVSYLWIQEFGMSYIANNTDKYTNIPINRNQIKQKLY